mmetsp:Transcript_3831/g.11952  ORF Transcript_3831/g.11952 Transcript_3831/m.11952 type:complete len:268 (+) Transcript_3831:749-1552(+)
MARSAGATPALNLLSLILRTWSVVLPLSASRTAAPPWSPSAQSLSSSSVSDVLAARPLPSATPPSLIRLDVMSTFLSVTLLASASPSALAAAASSSLPERLSSVRPQSPTAAQMGSAPVPSSQESSCKLVSAGWPFRRCARPAPMWGPHSAQERLSVASDLQSSSGGSRPLASPFFHSCEERSTLVRLLLRPTAEAMALATAGISASRINSRLQLASSTTSEGASSTILARAIHPASCIAESLSLSVLSRLFPASAAHSAVVPSARM